MRGWSCRLNTSQSDASWPSGARPRLLPSRPVRIRSGSWTSASSRPLPRAPGDRAAGPGGDHRDGQWWAVAVLALRVPSSLPTPNWPTCAPGSRPRGQNGPRERGLGTLKYERLYLDEIDDALMLAERAEDYRVEYNEIRPHETISWNRPKEVHLGLADPTIPNFPEPEILPTTRHGTTTHKARTERSGLLRAWRGRVSLIPG